MPDFYRNGYLRSGIRFSLKNLDPSYAQRLLLSQSLPVSGVQGFRQTSIAEVMHHALKQELPVSLCFQFNSTSLQANTWVAICIFC